MGVARLGAQEPDWIPHLRDWQAQNSVFEDIEAFRSVDVTLTGHGDQQRLQTRQTWHHAGEESQDQRLSIG